MKTLFDDNGAEFSRDKKYRFCLWRIWDTEKPTVMFVGLNPSTANEHENDPTIRRVIGFAKDWGFGGVYMMNLFPIVSTDPKVLTNTKHPDIITTYNWSKLFKIQSKCEMIICAWGNFSEARERGEWFKKLFGKKCYALCVNKNKSPRHPLYVPSTTKPIPF